MQPGAQMSKMASLMCLMLHLGGWSSCILAEPFSVHVASLHSEVQPEITWKPDPKRRKAEPAKLLKA